MEGAVTSGFSMFPGDCVPGTVTVCRDWRESGRGGYVRVFSVS